MTVRVAGSQLVRNILPFTMTESGWLVMLSGSMGLDRTVFRPRSIVAVSPEGNRIERDRLILACMPKRGSGPCWAEILVPSGVIVTALPSLATVVVVVRPAPLVAI